MAVLEKLLIKTMWRWGNVWSYVVQYLVGPWAAVARSSESAKVHKLPRTLRVPMFRDDFSHV